MSVPLYDICVSTSRQMLGGLRDVLDKAEAHANAHHFKPETLLSARLFPNMFDLCRQVQIACDSAKLGCARLAGVAAPQHEDNETSFAQLRARIDATLEFIAGIPREKFDGREDAVIEVPIRERKLVFKGRDLALRWMLPNFYFHVTTAYDLLRHNGVPLGKADYLGKFQDAG